MSYCRFSSMNWMSDVYVYEDVSGGWTTHVAARRRLFGPIPDIMTSPLSMRLFQWSGGQYDKATRTFTYTSSMRRIVYESISCFETFWHNWVHMGSLHLIPLRPIGLPYDGKSFNDSSPRECAERLEWLRGLGYKVPQHAIDSLKKEALL